MKKREPPSAHHSDDLATRLVGWPTLFGNKHESAPVTKFHFGSAAPYKLKGSDE